MYSTIMQQMSQSWLEKLHNVKIKFMKLCDIFEYIYFIEIVCVWNILVEKARSFFFGW